MERVQRFFKRLYLEEFLFLFSRLLETVLVRPFVGEFDCTGGIDLRSSVGHDM
jgi:hypothetical protein